MNVENRKELEIELELLTEILKFHSEKWGKLSMSESETENHIDDMLDRINEIKQILKTIENE